MRINVGMVAAFVAAGGLSVGCNVGLTPVKEMMDEYYSECPADVQLWCDGTVREDDADLAAYDEECIDAGYTVGLDCGGWMPTECPDPLALSCDDQCDGVIDATWELYSACIDAGYTVDIDCEADCDCGAGSGSVVTGETDVRPWCSSGEESSSPPPSPPPPRATPPTAVELRTFARDVSALLGRPRTEQHAFVERELRPRMASIGLGTNAQRGFGLLWGHRVVDALAENSEARAGVRNALTRYSQGLAELPQTVSRCFSIIDPLTLDD